MARKPRVTTNPGANTYVGDNERIIEFFDDTLQLGGLIALRRADNGRLQVQVYNVDEGVDVSTGKAPVVEIVHTRDPDSECYTDVFVDGVHSTNFVVEDIDPGRGHERASWDESTRYVAEHEGYSQAFKDAVVAARNENADSQYVVGEPESLEDRAEEWFAEASSSATASEADTVKAAVLMLAIVARDYFDNADRVVLVDSDQGEWVTVDKVLDADGNDLDPDWDIFDDNGYASWLADDYRSVWTPYAPKTEDSSDNSPVFVLKIDDVLARIEPPT